MGGLGAWALHDANEQATELRKGLGSAFTTIGGDLSGGFHNAADWLGGGVDRIAQGFSGAASGVSNALNNATGGALGGVTGTISLMLEIATAAGIAYAGWRVYRLVRA